MKSIIYHINFSIKEILAKILEFVIISWIVFALFLVWTGLFLQIIGRDDINGRVNEWYLTKFDYNYKSHPNNILYEEEKSINVESVTNLVKIGKLAGNRNLEFGVKNILEEFLQEEGYDINPNAPYKLQVQIVYLDVLTTKKNISVFHKNEEEVVIRMKGILYKDGKKVKEVIVEEASSEISISTLIVDEGGKFNQTSLSNALKKGCGSLITKLFEGNK
jgi:hypothetical protein